MDLQSQIRAEVQKQVAANQFRQSELPYHIHNGKDAPPVFNPTRIYTGFVSADGDISGASSDGFIMMPQGWKVELSAGAYRVIHNLGTEFYTVAACQTEQAQVIFPRTICLPNEFEITWLNVAFGAVTCNFHFVLTQINNKAAQFPNYTTAVGV